MDCLNWDLYEDDIDNNNCEFIDEIQNKGYHLRVTGEKKQLTELVEQYIKQFKPSVYIFAYEEKDKNHHIHGHLEYSKLPKSFKQALSQWMKSRGYTGKYYHQQIVTTNEQNKLYITKDLDIIKHNLTEEQMDQLKQATNEINEDKKLSQRHKLTQAFNDYLSTQDPARVSKMYTELKDIAHWIMRYYLNKYDKEPPLAHIKGYTIYIASKCDIREQFSYQINHLFDNLF